MESAESDFEDDSEPSSTSSPDLSDNDDGDARLAGAAAAPRGIEPYLFEPLADAPPPGLGDGDLAGPGGAAGEDDAAARDNANADVELEARLGNNNW